VLAVKGKPDVTLPRTMVLGHQGRSLMSQPLRHTHLLFYLRAFSRVLRPPRCAGVAI
jgi:hypothetical protein